MTTAATEEVWGVVGGSLKSQGNTSILLCQAGSKASDRHQLRSQEAHQVKWGLSDSG